MTTTTITSDTGTATLSAQHALVHGRVGVSITWDAWDVSVDRDVLLVAVGLYAPRFLDFVPHSGDAGACLTRAMARRQGAHKEAGLRWEPIADDDAHPGMRRVALAQAHRKGTFSADTRLEVTVDLTTGSISSDRMAEDDDEGKAVDQLFARYRKERSTLTASKVTGAFLPKCLERLHALKLSGSSSVYLVRAPEDAELVGLERALEVAKVSLIPIAVMPDGARALGAAARRTLAAEASDLLSQARKRAEAVAAGKTPRTETLLEADREVRDMLARAEAFSELLEVNTSQVGGVLAEVAALLESTQRVIAARVVAEV
jgi:hypothetical protein